MKTNSAPARYRKAFSNRRYEAYSPSWRSMMMLWLLVVGLGVLLPARADLSAPDNILYGTIVVGTNQATASTSSLLVEARRNNGLPVARYQMGDRPDAGNFYELRIKVEEIPPCRDAAAVLPGEVLAIAVINNGIVQTQRTFRVTERGQATRLDFGILTTNIFTGYQAWASARGLGLDSQNLDADGDGISNSDEYVAGTDPANADSGFILSIAASPTGALVSFTAVQAQGVGYEARNRHYALEQREDLLSRSWFAVPGHSDLVGANQMVSYTARTTNAPLFFRGKVWLDSTQSGPQ